MKWLAFAVLLIAVIGGIIYLEPNDGEVQKVTPVKERSGKVAPELAGISGYINTDNINISEFVGKKVILVDMWTYSCINCQRTLPYITAWHEKYKDKGLVIIGVHAPEFDFEKNPENVKRAVEKFNIKYPVVLDNDHVTWRAFENRYWPAKYLIDKDGYIVYSHFGEGDYDETEKKIQELLGLKEDMASVSAESVEFRMIGTPELYLGYQFTRGNFGNTEGLQANKEITYSLPESMSANDIYLEGIWFVDKDHVRLVSETGKIALKYDAKNVNIVASGKSSLSVSVDGVNTQNIPVDADDLYRVVEGAEYGKHDLIMDVSGSGFKLYTFTFG